MCIRDSVHLVRARLPQVTLRIAAAEHRQARHPGAVAGPYVPDGVADEHRRVGGDPAVFQGALHQVGGRFARRHVVGAGDGGDGVLRVQRAAHRLQLGAVRRTGQHHRPAALRARPQQLGGAVERGQPLPVLGEECAVRRPDRLVLVAVPVLAEQVADQMVGPHADGPVDLRHGHPVPGLPERLPPGDGVQVGAVDQRSVDIEECGSAWAHPCPSFRVGRSCTDPAVLPCRRGPARVHRAGPPVSGWAALPARTGSGVRRPGRSGR